MSGTTHSLHCLWLILPVSLLQRSSLLTSAGHSRMAPSPLEEAMLAPSGLNATLSTQFWWPRIGCPNGLPVAAFHSRTVLSTLPETMRLPSELNATLVTVP